MRLVERLKRLPLILAICSFVYSAFELGRYICVYVAVARVPFPSIFHAELVIVGFGPLYFVVRGLYNGTHPSINVNRGQT